MIVERRRGRGKETDTTALHSFLLQLAFSLETSHGEELIRWIAARGIRYLHQVWINQRKCITRYFSREREWNKKKKGIWREYLYVSRLFGSKLFLSKKETLNIHYPNSSTRNDIFLKYFYRWEIMRLKG